MVYVTQNIEEFYQLLKELNVNKNPFQTLSFYKNYFVQYPSKDYIFFVVKRDGVVVGIAPFEIVHNNIFLREYRFIATRKINYQEYICLEGNTEFVHNELVNYFKENRKATKIHYYDINNQSEIYEILSNDRNRAFIELYRCPLVVLQNDFETFFKEQIKEAKKRTEIRKFYKKISSLGEVKMLTADSEESFKDYEEYIKQIFLIHKERFDGVYTPSHFSDIGFREYYLNIIKDTLSNGNGYLSFLTIDETVVSFILCLKNEQTLIDWIPAFDPAFEKYNLGTVHYYLLFQKLSEEGKYKYFDYSKGDSVYKRRWANAETINYSVDLIFNGNAMAKLFFAMGRLKNKIKVCLRKKGILKKIKRIMGRYIKEQLGERILPTPVEIINVDVCEDNFDYSLIRKATVKDRIMILNALYVGKTVCLKRSGERVIAEVSE